MNLDINIIHHQQVFSNWAGCSVKPSDDFETFCDCNYDFIELLLVFEREFFLNLLDSQVSRHDFINVRDFLKWTMSQPAATQTYIPFKWHQAEVVPILL